MSKVGKEPIQIPKGVDITLTDDKVVVKGPKGTLEQAIHYTVGVEISEDQVLCSIKTGRTSDSKFQGLMRSLISNMVIGVTKGFVKELKMIGVGYRAQVQGSSLNLQIGVSHPVIMQIPADVNVDVKSNTNITIEGPNKQVVGQFAADVRAKRPPEPYQGKGIRYVDEHVRRKAGKAAKGR